jgi:hypothetical protein
LVSELYSLLRNNQRDNVTQDKQDCSRNAAKTVRVTEGRSHWLRLYTADES